MRRAGPARPRTSAARPCLCLAIACSFVMLRTCCAAFDGCFCCNFACIWLGISFSSCIASCHRLRSTVRHIFHSPPGSTDHFVARRLPSTCWAYQPVSFCTVPGSASNSPFCLCIAAAKPSRCWVPRARAWMSVAALCTIFALRSLSSLSALSAFSFASLSSLSLAPRFALSFASLCLASLSAFSLRPVFSDCFHRH